jgi:hypothetical protein
MQQYRIYIYIYDCGRELYLCDDGLVKAETFWTYGTPNNKVCRETDHCIWLDSNKISCNTRTVKSIIILVVVVVVVVAVVAYVLSQNVCNFFHCNNGFTNAPYCCVIRTLPVLLNNRVIS